MRQKSCRQQRIHDHVFTNRFITALVLETLLYDSENGRLVTLVPITSMQASGLGGRSINLSTHHSRYEQSRSLSPAWRLMSQSSVFLHAINVATLYDTPQINPVLDISLHHRVDRIAPATFPVSS